MLGEVAKLLDRKPHQITHLLTTGKVAEPAQRISNKRLFTEEDVARLARHFRVAPRWDAVETAPSDAEVKTDGRLILRPPFEVISAREGAHEVCDGDGQVFAWASERGRALVMAGLLEAAVRG